jgi:hypothetical protein
MSKEHLINLKNRSKEERINIARKGGLVKSEKKALANSIKNIKSGIYATKFTKRILELSRNPEKSASQIFDLIERVGDDFDELDKNLQIKVARLLLEAHRVVHSSAQAAMVQFNMNQELNKPKEIDIDKMNKELDEYIESIK